MSFAAFVEGRGTPPGARRRHRLAGALALVAGLAGAVGLPPPAAAESLPAALAEAYLTNPTLVAARAELRVVDEQVPEAKSARRPTLSITGSAGADWSETSLRDSFQRTNPRQIGIEATQPVYRGGRIDAGIRVAENGVLAQRARLHDTEQQVLLAAATAYFDVVRDLAVVELTKNNERVLERQLEATRDRFRVGEITRTDVSQAESRLSRANADRIEAEGFLANSRATYARVVGSVPGELTRPTVALDLPSGLDEAVALARAHNPAVLAAVYTEAAARDTVDQVDGEFWPSADLSASVSRSFETSLGDDSYSNDVTVLAQVSIPLYQSGAVMARARGARQQLNQRRLQVSEARRSAQEQAIQAWQSLVTARASIESRKAQVRSAEIALEGVRQEATVGSRTVLDVLDAEQELLDARVQLVRAERDETVAAFSVLSAIGQLDAQGLGLDVPHYRPEAYYNRVRDRWFGIDIN